MIETRKFIRYPLTLPVKLETMELDRTEVLDLETRDISASGTFIPTLKSFSEGTRVRLDFTILTNDPTKFKDVERLKGCRGKIVRSTPVGFAIQFDNGCQIESLKAS